MAECLSTEGVLKQVSQSLWYLYCHPLFPVKSMVTVVQSNLQKYLYVGQVQIWFAGHPGMHLHFTKLFKNILKLDLAIYHLMLLQQA